MLHHAQRVAHASRHTTEHPSGGARLVLLIERVRDNFDFFGGFLENLEVRPPIPL